MKLVWYVSSYTGMQASNQINTEFVVFLTLNDTKMLQQSILQKSRIHYSGQ